MPLQRSPTADKTSWTVEDASQHRCRARHPRTRDRLSQRAGNPAFERELLKLHARGDGQRAPRDPADGAVISAVGLFAGMATQILIWALVTVVCYAGSA